MPSPLVKMAIRARVQDASIRAKTDLWWLATEVLGFDKLTEAFHKPMLDRLDVMRTLRKIGKGRDTLMLWPREHYKTTVRKAQVIQTYLCDPTATITWWHSVEEHAQEASIAIGTQLQKNKELRKLFPDGVLPALQAKRFIGAKGFRLYSNRVDDAPSFRAWGQTSEATGGHSLYGVMDDIIARNTIEDSAMPKVRSWYRNTVRNVVLSSGWLDGTGTRWDQEDIYADWLLSKHWEVTVRAALETDGVPDYKGKSVLFPMAAIRKKREEMGESDFAAQMMNDPSPAGEKPWEASSCEHEIAWKEALKGSGVIVVLSDPAPAKVGAYIEEKKRDDGEKDFWATAVVRFRTNGQRREIILLDGAQSKDWGVEEGFRVMCAFKRKWGARHHAIEKTGQAVAFYEDTWRRISREEGVKNTSLELTLTYKGKNLQFRRLADKAKSDEFLIADTVPKDFRDAFINQARQWRPLKGGRNSLKYDDAANCVSFAADPVFEGLTPQPSFEPEKWNPFQDPNADGYQQGGRYIRY